VALGYRLGEVYSKVEVIRWFGGGLFFAQDAKVRG
jgi:hypothetical protein